MKMKSITEIYLSATPKVRIIVNIIQYAILIAVVLLFPYPKIPFSPYVNIFGIIVITAGFWLHGLSHQSHKQAHEKPEEIKNVVTTGIYAKIRHPGYLGLMLVYLGAPFAFSSFAVFIPVFIFSYPLYIQVKKEEEFLIKKFGREYQDYMKKVPWRFIPGIF
jgi:protein-S-isoprenylcysteine O-methyltransferase Ste14